MGNSTAKSDNGSSSSQTKHPYPEQFDDDVVTVKKWLRVWEDGIKTVTKAQDKWTQKHSELIKKEKEIQKEKEDLIYDQRMWYRTRIIFCGVFLFYQTSLVAAIYGSRISKKQS